MIGQNRGETARSALAFRWRRLRYLAGRVAGSLAQRGWRGTLARIAQQFRRRPSTDRSLPIAPLDTPFAPFALRVSATPRASVVIPVHGKCAYTVACLRAIARHGAAVPFEVIVVDDASPDDSAEVLARVGGLRLLRNPANLGFVGSCNAGAAAARGEVLVFLNNDTQVLSGWLDALLACLDEEPRCGIAGSRLVYPDGRLQEAGGLVYADGACWNVGRFASRDEPRYRFRREVDYVSGAALAIPKTLFDRVGGFDQRYAPAYYEDTGLAFAVREAGYRVCYEPASVVVHFEGITTGTDPLAGVKQYQLRNREAFRARWAQALAAQPAPGTRVEQALQRGRRRMLVVDVTAPDPARDSGSLRLTEIFRLLHAMDWEVAFAADDGRPDDARIDALGALGVETIADAPHSWLRRHGDTLDAVMLCRVGIAAQYLAPARRHAPRARLLFDTVDLHFLREGRAAEVSGQAALARRAAASRRDELQAIAASDVTFVVSPVERALLRECCPDARVELLSNIHRVHGRGAGFDARRDLVFVGGFGHPPNADAVRWMAEAILPALRTARPDLQLHVLGDVPDDARRALAAPGLVFHGRVADLQPFMDGCRVSVAPLRFGAGVKGKVNMAMRHGLPVVATAVAAEGMQLADGVGVLLADTAEAFAAAVLRLYDDAALWMRLSDAGLENVRRHFSPLAAADALRRALAD